MKELSAINKKGIKNWYYSPLYLKSNIKSHTRLFEIKNISDNLCIFYRRKYKGEQKKMFYPPLGNCNDKILKECLKIAPGGVQYVYSGFKTELKLKKEHPDYIYDLKQISELKGSNYHNQRNMIKRFKRDNEFIWRPIKEETDKAKILELNKQWKNGQGKKHYDNMFDRTYSVTAIKYLLKDSISYVVEIDNKIVGFVMGGKLTKDYCLTFLRKCDVKYKGLSDFLFWKFYEEMYHKGFKFGNDGSDIGFPGLKKFKMGYNPIKFIQNYKIEGKKHKQKSVEEWI